VKNNHSGELQGRRGSESLGSKKTCANDIARWAEMSIFYSVETQVRVSATKRTDPNLSPHFGSGGHGPGVGVGVGVGPGGTFDFADM
jgi:hypothetical protein